MSSASPEIGSLEAVLGFLSQNDFKAAEQALMAELELRFGDLKMSTMDRSGDEGDNASRDASASDEWGRGGEQTDRDEEDEQDDGEADEQDEDNEEEDSAEDPGTRGSSKAVSSNDGGVNLISSSSGDTSEGDSDDDSGFLPASEHAPAIKTDLRGLPKRSDRHRAHRWPDRRRSWGSGTDEDEYDADDDPGYLRGIVMDPDAFLAHEIVSGDERRRAQEAAWRTPTASNGDEDGDDSEVSDPESLLSGQAGVPEARSTGNTSAQAVPTNTPPLRTQMPTGVGPNSAPAAPGAHGSSFGGILSEFDPLSVISGLADVLKGQLAASQRAAVRGGQQPRDGDAASNDGSEADSSVFEGRAADAIAAAVRARKAGAAGEGSGGGDQQRPSTSTQDGAPSEHNHLRMVLPGDDELAGLAVDHTGADLANQPHSPHGSSNQDGFSFTPPISVTPPAAARTPEAAGSPLAPPSPLVTSNGLPAGTADAETVFSKGCFWSRTASGLSPSHVEGASSDGGDADGSITGGTGGRPSTGGDVKGGVKQRLSQSLSSTSGRGADDKGGGTTEPTEPAPGEDDASADGEPPAAVPPNPNASMTSISGAVEQQEDDDDDDDDDGDNIDEVDVAAAEEENDAEEPRPASEDAAMAGDDDADGDNDGGGEGDAEGGDASALDETTQTGFSRFEEEDWYHEYGYEVLDLKVIHRSMRTGFEESKDISVAIDDVIAGRYQVVDLLGSGAFSRAVHALDLHSNRMVCLKIVKNNKDYFDQSLDEVKLLRYVNGKDPSDEHGLLRLHDFFYYKEHLFIACELLKANLYEFQKYNTESGDEPYFTVPRLQAIARQVLRSLAFLHSLNLVHCDLKPENILVKSYSRCEVKVIDLGSSCFITDHLSSYVQSRSYRAPEVVLGLPYDYKIDVWSLGCILAELSTGHVLFSNDSLATMLARIEGILGPLPQHMLDKGRFTHRFYTRSGQLYDRDEEAEQFIVLRSKRSSLRHRVPEADEGFLSFLSALLEVDPAKRPNAREALQHPWLQEEYEDTGIVTD
ncbi:unnamed protein product [Pedinophyceae sp. YPF-701]|nr:unnamed protein product [Pedinophyceae sp. YPF-701]